MLYLILSTLESKEQQEKFKYIYRNFHAEMIKFAKYQLYVHNVYSYEADSEDIVQESLIRLSKYIDSFDMSLGKESNKMYVITVVKNVINDFLNKREAIDIIEEYEDIADEDIFFERLTKYTTYDRLLCAVSKLDEKYQTVFVLHYKRNMTAKEIAALLNTPVKTIETRILRAKKTLIKLLEEDVKNGL